MSRIELTELERAKMAEAGRQSIACTHGWRPIETAPKDQWILVHEPDWHTMVAKWVYDNQWYYAKGRDNIYLSCRPTHWQPLPKPPEGAEQ